MKLLLSTTALVLALGVPTLMSAQTTQPATGSAQAQAGTDMPGFLAMRGQYDLFASELMGQDVYARRASNGMAATTGQTTATTTGQTTAGQTTAVQTNTALAGTVQSGMTADGTRTMTMMNRADLDGMDNIGKINEIVLSTDGQVRAIVIGVGGFLGMGEQDVAVTMDQVSFSSDRDDLSKMYIVVNTGADMLKGSPAYDRTAAMTDRTQTTEGTQTKAAAGSDRTAFSAPKVQRDGYDQIEATEVTAEMLVGKEVYGVNDNSVGTIDDLILDDKGAITNVIIDFGGFLGMGTSQVSVGYDELTILANDGRADVRVYVDATKEQIQAQPQYRVGN